MCSSITIVELVLKDNSLYKTRTLLDSGSGTSWCHVDLLKHVKYNDLGSITMQVQVFEGYRKKKYKYVELFYTVHGQIDTLRCFLTDQYAWLNEIRVLHNMLLVYYQIVSLILAQHVIMTKVRRKLH